ncbi:S41 family peptidase [Candidatus Dependentiae bacterium]|nr:S41 family peptidase [Candidatus Dependentiae bacterium]
MKHVKLSILVCVMTITITVHPTTTTAQAGNQRKPFLVSAATQYPFFNANHKEKPKQEREKDIFQWFRTISEVVHLISEKHYRHVDFPDFIQNALKSAVPNTDPHSSFFSKKSYLDAMESTSGKFSGIGVSIMSKTPEDNFLIIIDVIQGGPSDQAGLKGGDKIVEVNNESLKGLSSDEVINKLRGKTGTTVKLKVIRAKKPLEFVIKRQVVKDQSLLCYNFTNQGIYYLSLKIFAENSTQQTAKILSKANGSCNGMIIDLRRNPGGILEAAVDMAGLFIEKNSLVVSTKDKNQKVISSYFTQKNPVLNKNIPIFILIDNFTASASEILAGCLRYYSEKNQNNLSVFLVGTKTFGKGSVQEVVPISNGCALKITTMLYYLPDGNSIQAKGIEPDFVVKPKTIPEKEIQWVKELYGEETALKNHITAEEAAGKPAITKNKIVPPHPDEKEESKEEMAKNWEERHRKAISQDVQVQACANMINLLNIAKKSTPTLVDTRQKTLDFLKQNYLTDKEVELAQVRG